MSNEAAHDIKRPILTRVEAQSDADIAIAAFESLLQQGWDQRAATISNRHFAVDVAWGSPYDATVHGFPPAARDSSPAQEGTSGVASRLRNRSRLAVSDDVIVVHVARYVLDPEGPQLCPSPILRARSRKWRSLSSFAVTEHGRLPLARIRRSDQVPPSHPLAEDVVTIKGKAVVHHQAGNEPRLARMSRRGKGLRLAMIRRRGR